MLRLREQYRAARAAIDAAFAQELAAMSEAEGLERARARRLFSTEGLPARESSGLIEQQVLFQKLAGRR
jgi:hypothetical protein